VVVAVTVMTACGDLPDDGPMSYDEVVSRARAAGQHRALELLEAGEVTAEAVRRYEDDRDDCLRALGVTIGERMISPIDGWSTIRDLSYEGLDIQYDEELRAAVTACDEEWPTGLLQIAYEFTHEEVMAEPLMRAVRSCMQARGLEVSGTERNARDLMAGEEPAGGRQGALRACVSDEVTRLYPELPWFAMAY
jgi:hypothetical protein